MNIEKQKGHIYFRGITQHRNGFCGCIDWPGEHNSSSKYIMETGIQKNKITIQKLVNG